MIKKILKVSFFRKLIVSISIRLLKLLKKNRGYFDINGFMMYLDFLDPIDRSIILDGSYEKEEINKLNNFIIKKNINIFIDIGSNCGFYSFNFANQNLEVLAFEPNSEALLKMNNTIKKNPYLNKKITIFPYGISNKNTRMKMQTLIKHGYTQTGGSGVTDSNKTKTNNIEIFEAEFKIGDDILKYNDKSLAIKIDVEGHEIYVLKGIEKLLKSNKCILQIELFNKNFHLVNSYLNNNGYKNIDNVKERSNYFYSNF